MIQVGEDKGWASNMRHALDCLNADYLIYLQEDYFLTETVNTDRILSLLNFAIDEKAACLRLYPSPEPDRPYQGNSDVGEITVAAPYRVSLQAAIWNKHILTELVVEGESGWDMEIKGTIRSRRIAASFLSVRDLRAPAIPYLHRTGVMKGKWTREAVELCYREGISLDLSKRPIESEPSPSAPSSSSLTIFQRIRGRVWKSVERLRQAL